MPSLDDQVANQIANIERSSGKGLSEWIAIVRASGHQKHAQAVAWLKAEHGLGHGNANLIVTKAREAASGGPPTEEKSVASQYAGPNAGLPAPVRRRDRHGPGVRSGHRARAEEDVREPPPPKAVRTGRTGRRSAGDRTQPARQADHRPAAPDKRDGDAPSADQRSGWPRRGADRLVDRGVRERLTPARRPARPSAGA